MSSLFNQLSTAFQKAERGWPKAIFMISTALILLVVSSLVYLFRNGDTEVASLGQDPLPAALVVERSHDQPPLTEPSASLPALTVPAEPLVSHPSPAPVDPLLAEHSQHLSSLDAQIADLKTAITQLQGQFNQCQASTAELQTQLTQATVLPSPVHRLHRKRPVARHRRHHPGPSARPAAVSAPMVVVAVNTWGSEQRIIARHPGHRDYQQLKIGDRWGDWTIETTNGQQVILNSAQGRAVMTPQTPGQP